jgi:hypothetical protein
MDDEARCHSLYFGYTHEIYHVTPCRIHRMSQACRCGRMEIKKFMRAYNQIDMKMRNIYISIHSA